MKFILCEYEFMCSGRLKYFQGEAGPLDRQMITSDGARSRTAVAQCFRKKQLCQNFDNCEYKEMIVSSRFYLVCYLPEPARTA